MALKKRRIERQTFVRADPDYGVPADPERAKAMIAQAWRMLSMPPKRQVHEERHPWQAVTHGHGAQCVCEVCFPKRIAHVGAGPRQPGQDDEWVGQ